MYCVFTAFEIDRIHFKSMKCVIPVGCVKIGKEYVVKHNYVN